MVTMYFVNGFRLRPLFNFLDLERISGYILFRNYEPKENNLILQERKHGKVDIELLMKEGEENLTEMVQVLFPNFAIHQHIIKVNNQNFPWQGLKIWVMTCMKVQLSLCGHSITPLLSFSKIFGPFLFLTNIFFFPIFSTVTTVPEKFFFFKSKISYGFYRLQLMSVL